jgi:hypothetical protein
MPADPDTPKMMALAPCPFCGSAVSIEEEDGEFAMAHPDTGECLLDQWGVAVGLFERWNRRARPPIRRHPDGSISLHDGTAWVDFVPRIAPVGVPDTVGAWEAGRQPSLDAEPIPDITTQLRGRARFLRDRGEVKSPEAMEDAAREVERLREAMTELLSASEYWTDERPSDEIDHAAALGRWVAAVLSAQDALASPSNRPAQRPDAPERAEGAQPDEDAHG